MNNASLRFIVAVIFSGVFFAQVFPVAAFAHDEELSVSSFSPISFRQFLAQIVSGQGAGGAAGTTVAPATRPLAIPASTIASAKDPSKAVTVTLPNGKKAALTYDAKANKICIASVGCLNAPATGKGITVNIRMAPAAQERSADGSVPFLAGIVKNNPMAGAPLARVMGSEAGVWLSTALGALHTGAARSARVIADDMNYMMRTLLTTPPAAQETALARGVQNIADAFDALQFGGVTIPSPQSKQSLSRPAPATVAYRSGSAIASQSISYIPGIAIARAEDPSEGESDPFLKELERLYDKLFAPISLFGVPIVIPAGQPTKAIAYLKEAEQQVNEALRRIVEGDPADAEMALYLKLGELAYDLKTSVLECKYTPRDADKKIKRFLVDNYLKPALNALREKEERELDIYNADSSYGGRQTWSEEEQDALRENKQRGANTSTEEAIRQVAQNRIGRAERLRQTSSYGADEGGGSTYVHKAGRIKEDAALSGREDISLIAGNSDVSLAAYAKVITKYIAEDTLNLWVNSPNMDTSSIFRDIQTRVIQRFLATQLASDAQKKKIIEDAANAALAQLGFTLDGALKSGDEALAAYRNILNAIGSFANTYCKHKKEIDGLLEAADAVLAETGACDMAAADTPEDPLARTAKTAAAVEIKKFESSCQSAATTFVNLVTVAKNSLLQLLRDGIGNAYREHGLPSPSDIQIDKLFSTQASSDAVIEELYGKFYAFYEGKRKRETGLDEFGASVIAEDTRSALRAAVGVALHGHMLRDIKKGWLGNIKDIVDALKPKNGRCVAPSAFRYDPTLARIFELAKANALQSVVNAPSAIKQFLGDIRKKVGTDFYGGKDDKGNDIPADAGIVALERQLRAIDELIKRTLGLVAESQADIDAGLKTYKSVKASADKIEQVRTTYVAASKKAAQRTDEKAARQLAEDAKKQGRTGALARQRQADARADAESVAAKAEREKEALGLAQEVTKSVVSDVGDVARRDLEALKTARCPSGCSGGKKYQRVGAEVLGTCANNAVSVAVENIVCCDFGVAQVNPNTGKVEYICTDREPPAFTRYDNVVRVNVGPPGNPGREQYGSVWCANLPRALRQEECPIPDGQAIADAFCTWSGDSEKAGNITGREFYRMEPEAL